MDKYKTEAGILGAQKSAEAQLKAAQAGQGKQGLLGLGFLGL